MVFNFYKGETNIGRKNYRIIEKSFIIATFFFENIDYQVGFNLEKFSQKQNMRNYFSAKTSPCLKQLNFQIPIQME